MNRLIIVDQEKGGLWKTFLTVHLKTFLDSNGVVYRPVDFDYVQGLLVRIFPPPVSANISPNPVKLLTGESALMQLMHRALAGDRFIVDCGANTGVTWETLFTEVWPNLRDEMRAADLKLTIVVPFDADEKCMDSYLKYKELFPEATIVLAVIRSFKTQTVKLPEHPRELTIEPPRAPAHLFEAYRTHALTIDAIAKMGTDDKSLGLDVGFARAYLPELHKEFKKILQHLI